MIRVRLPAQLCSLANVGREVQFEMPGQPSLAQVLDILEARYPMLRGTIRDQVTHERRPFIRFFACGEDLSQQSPELPLPGEIAAGEEPLRVVGAMAGG